MTEWTVLPIPELTGVTTALVVFILLCMAFPALVRHRRPFHWAFGLVLGTILLHCLSLLIRAPGFVLFNGVMSGLLQIGILVLLFLASGGLTVNDLSDGVRRGMDQLRDPESRDGLGRTSGQGVEPEASASASSASSADEDRTMPLR